MQALKFTLWLVILVTFLSVKGQEYIDEAEDEYDVSDAGEEDAYGADPVSDRRPDALRREQAEESDEYIDEESEDSEGETDDDGYAPSDDLERWQNTSDESDLKVLPTRRHWADYDPQEVTGILRVKVGIMRRAKKRHIAETKVHTLPIHRQAWHRQLLAWSEEKGIHPQQPEMCVSHPIQRTSTNGICISVFGYYQGGLSNTIGFINDGLDFAVKYNYGFVFPYVRPPEHFLGVGMIDMFQDLSHEELPFPIYDEWDCVVPGSDCMIRTKILPGHPNINLISPNITNELLARARVEHLPKPMVEQAKAQNCKVLAFLESVMDTRVKFDYSKTHALFQQQYYRHACQPWKPHDVLKPMWAPPGRITVLVHHRLGDLKKKTGENSMRLRKHLSPLYPLIIISALANILTADCLHVVISTETGTHEEIKAIRDLLPEGTTDKLLAFPYAKRWLAPGMHRDRAAFEAMVNADVLVAGMSGFSRYAAVLSRNARIAPKYGSEHPLTGISEDLLLVPDIENSFWSFPSTAGDDIDFYRVKLQTALMSPSAKKLEVGLRHLIDGTGVRDRCGTDVI